MLPFLYPIPGDRHGEAARNDTVFHTAKGRTEVRPFFQNLSNVDTDGVRIQGNAAIFLAQDLGEKQLQRLKPAEDERKLQTK